MSCSSSLATTLFATAVTGFVAYVLSAQLLTPSASIRRAHTTKFINSSISDNDDESKVDDSDEGMNGCIEQLIDKDCKATVSSISRDASSSKSYLTLTLSRAITPGHENQPAAPVQEKQPATPEHENQPTTTFPLLKFCKLFLEQYSLRVRTTTFVLIADASGGSASSLLSTLLFNVFNIDVVNLPFMVQLACFSALNIFSNDDMSTIIKALTIVSYVASEQ